MKNFKRNNLLFSLCGLNCGLCPMYLDNYCPGCGGGVGNQLCAIARCSGQHDEVEYCYQCKEFPCEKYEGIDEFDSFITHRNQRNDFERAMKIGLDAYTSEQYEKVEILKYLLANYNDGRRKSFFCVAVNLLELQDVKSVMKQMMFEMESEELALKEKAIRAVNLFQAMAAERDIVLKLNKKPRKKK